MSLDIDMYPDRSFEDAAYDMAQEFGTQVTSDGRVQVCAPQGTVVQMVRARKGERTYRAHEACGYAPHELYAPPSTSDADFTTEKGMIGMIVTQTGSHMRGSLGSDTTARLITCVSGLPRDTPLGHPCVVKLHNDATKMQGEDLVTVGLAGTETIINNGLGRININDRVWFDPNPCVVTDLDGTKRPAVLIPGLSPTAMYFQTRAYTPLTTVSDILIYQRRCQKLLLAPEMRTKINACRDHHDLYAVTTGVVKRVCDGVYLAIDNPMRHYLDVWMAMFLATAVQSGDEPLLEGRSYSHALVVVYSALRLALVAHEQRASTTTQTYEETLVHEVMDGEWANVPTGVAGAPHRFATARSDALGDLLKTENLCAASTEGDATLMLFKAFGRLVKLTEEYQLRNHANVLSYNARRCAGTALSSAGPGEKFDILMGSSS
jgi:hypothetical protein